MEGNNPDGYKVNEEGRAKLVARRAIILKKSQFFCLNACLG